MSERVREREREREKEGEGVRERQKKTISEQSTLLKKKINCTI